MLEDKGRQTAAELERNGAAVRSSRLLKIVFQALVSVSLREIRNEQSNTYRDSSDETDHAKPFFNILLGVSDNTSGCQLNLLICRPHQGLGDRQCRC